VGCVGFVVFVGFVGFFVCFFKNTCCQQLRPEHFFVGVGVFVGLCLGFVWVVVVLGCFGGVFCVFGFKIIVECTYLLVIIYHVKLLFTKYIFINKNENLKKKL